MESKNFIICNFGCLKLRLVVCLMSRINGKKWTPVWSFKPCVFEQILGKNELNVTLEVSLPTPCLLQGDSILTLDGLG